MKSYPTLRFYPKGSTEGESYTGGRSEADLVSFINSRSGTYRTEGGGLNTIAGTIPSLDEIVSTLKSGGAEAYKSFDSAASALSGTYAEYYAKVAKKMEQNQEYASKELTRLQNLLKKNVAGEKKDDLTIRTNILNKFMGKDEQVKDEL